MKRFMFLLLELCWLLFGLGFGFFLVQYVTQGAGQQFFAPLFSSGTVLIGLVHVMGLALASGLCFIIGLGFCAHSLVPEREPQENAK